MPTSLEKIMEATQPLHEKSVNSKRAARRLIVHYCDTKSLLALRLVSNKFAIWIRTEERRYFHDLRITLGLTDGCPILPKDWKTLELPGSIAERIIFRFEVRGGGRKIEFKQRHQSGGGEVARLSTLNPLPKEGHFDTRGKFSLIEPSIPILGGIFRDFENNLFKKVLDMTPNVRTLCIRDCVYWDTKHPGMVDTDWGRTLVDEALIYLRCQLEELLLDRLKEHSRLKEISRCLEVVRLKEVAQFVESPINHLGEMIRLAGKLQLDELFQLGQQAGLTESSFIKQKIPKMSRTKGPLVRPRLLNWLSEMAEITSSPPIRLKELARFAESSPALLKESLKLAEMLRLEELHRIKELAPIRFNSQARAQKLSLPEESLPARLEFLAQLEELAVLAENSEDRLRLLYRFSRNEESLTISPEELARYKESPKDRLELRAQLAKLARPPILEQLEIQASSPLALWHFRTFPGYRNGGDSIQKAGIWATIKSLKITLPENTSGQTPGRRRTVKKSIHDFLAAFSKQVETLNIGFRPNSAGATASENPLTYHSDLEFGGGGERAMYPALRKLRLENMRLTWTDGLREFFMERAPNCISVELFGVRFANKDDWDQLYQMFTLEKKTKSLVLVLDRNLKLLGSGKP